MGLLTSNPAVAESPRHLFFYTPPEMFQRENEIELERELRTEGDPEHPPPRKPGDRYIAGGAMIGMVVGGASGGVIAWAYPGLPMVVMVVGGIVAGSFLGLLIGDRLKKRSLSARRSREARVGGSV